MEGKFLSALTFAVVLSIQYCAATPNRDVHDRNTGIMSYKGFSERIKQVLEKVRDNEKGEKVPVGEVKISNYDEIRSLLSQTKDPNVLFPLGLRPSEYQEMFSSRPSAPYLKCTASDFERYEKICESARDHPALANNCHEAIKKHSQYCSEKEISPHHFNDMMAAAIEGKFWRMIAMTLMGSLRLASSASYYKCQPLATAPDMSDEMAWRENIVSLVGTANMVGHIHLFDKGYMPMVLKKLEVSHDRVIFTSDCATLSLRYKVNSVPEISLHAAYVEVPIERDNQTKLTRLCEIPDIYVSYDAHYRLSCERRVNMLCVAPEDADGYAKPVAELVLDTFNMQLSSNIVRNIDKTRQIKFSASPIPISCDIISGALLRKESRQRKKGAL